jgi:Glycosyl transferase family 2
MGAAVTGGAIRGGCGGRRCAEDYLSGLGANLMLHRVFARAASRLDPVAGLQHRVGALKEQLWTLHDEAYIRWQTTLSPRQLWSKATELGARYIDSARWLATHHARFDPVRGRDVGPAPLVSVIMPVWNREHRMRNAIQSVLAQTYPHWELVIVDDGSTDGTREAVAEYLTEPRIRYFCQAHAGHCVARNRGLWHSRGDIIAYLDSDNTWYPRYLETVTGALAAEPAVDSVYLAQLVRGRLGVFVRGRPFDREGLERANYIDLNVFAHRRQLVERLGGFDEKLTRLVDWDLILRYTARAAPRALPVLGGCYESGHTDRISKQENCARNDYLVRRKLQKPIGSNLRVLYALWHYPQLTESYIRWEIACMRRWGVHVEVWSELESPASTFSTDVPVHHGSLSAAIEKVAPHLVHVHWLHSALKYSDAIGRAGLPLTVRAHGFDFNRRNVAALERSPLVQAIYLFPHLARLVPGSSKVRPMNTAFNGELFYPVPKKDPRLVVRTGPGLPTKDLQTFFDAALKCPEHRFVLAVARCNEYEGYLDKLSAYNRKVGNPVDLRFNLSAEEIAPLVREAGIYLHTHGLIAPFGMPMSIAESMATGGYVLGRRCRASVAYIGRVGKVYDSAAEAADLIHSTTSWNEERWHRVRLAAVERAYQHFADIHVLRPILSDWLRIAGPSASFSLRDTDGQGAAKNPLVPAAA